MLQVEGVRFKPLDGGARFVPKEGRATRCCFPAVHNCNTLKGCLTLTRCPSWAGVRLARGTGRTISSSLEVCTWSRCVVIARSALA